MRVIFPGSFDPVTLGHLNIIKRAASLFDEVIVAVLENNQKQPLFPTQERIEMLEELLYDIDNVEVEVFSGLLADYYRLKDADAVLRGLRTPSDYEYERQLAALNHSLYPGLETLFLVTETRYSFISSSYAREVASYGGNISGLVPCSVARKLYRKFFSDPVVGEKMKQIQCL